MSASDKRMSKTISYSGLFILAALFVVINMVSTNLFNGMRIDLTQNKLYTLSEGTLNIVDSIQEPITFNYFFSDQASKDIPQIRTYATRVRELLQEYVQLSDGKITLHVIDPVAYSEEEDQANEYELQGVPIGAGGETFYFGLSASNSVGESEVIPFFQPDKEQFLEYEITKLIYTLSNAKKPVVGVLSRIPMFASFDVATQRVRDPWVVIRQLQQLYEVRNIDVAAKEFDEDLELLMVVFPKDLSQETLYAIDQYVMRGGNLIVYVDPHAESYVPVMDPNSPLEPEGARSSNLSLLDAYGIDYSPSRVVGDRRYALTVEEGGREVRHFALLGLDKDAFQANDVIMSGLDVITMGITGTVNAKADAEIEFETLMHSSQEAMLYEASKFRFLPKVSSLAQDFKPTGTEYPVAGRFQLQPESAFAEAIEGQENAHISKAEKPVNIIVIADVDLLSDRMWVQVQDFLGQEIVNPWASNGDFAINVVDNMLGSSDLISVRGRATATKPFTRVEELRRDADDRFRAEEQILQNKLRQTEQKLAQLQAQRGDDNSLILSDEQTLEIARFQDEKLQVRKELRRVRHELDKNIQQLGAWLKAINIGLVPVLLTILALLLSAIRMKKRSQHHI